VLKFCFFFFSSLQAAEAHMMNSINWSIRLMATSTLLNSLYQEAVLRNRASRESLCGHWDLILFAKSTFVASLFVGLVQLCRNVTVEVTFK